MRHDDEDPRTAGDAEAARPGGGRAAGGDGPRRLDRAPGERYRDGLPTDGRAGPSSGGGARDDTGRRAAGTRTGAATAAAAARSSPARAWVAGGVVALVAAIGYAALGQVDLGPGLLAVAAFVGWVVALALIWGGGGSRAARRPVVAAALGGGAIVLGLLLAWAISRTEGGVLDPLSYTDERYGLLAWVEIAVAAGVAWLRAR